MRHPHETKVYKMKTTIYTLPVILPFVSISIPIHIYAQSKTENKKPNVLFIIVDDLRPELGCYGVNEIKTPNIDQLAAKSIVFKNAYCNIPVSGASRASLFTGMYPKFPDRFQHFSSRANVDAPNAIPFNRIFTENGYYTISNGKVFHHIDDHADSWSEPPFRTHPEGYDVYNYIYNRWEMWLDPESGKYINPKTLRGPFYEKAEVPDSAYDDGKLTLKTMHDLKRLKAMDNPFFLACGFWKPHLPFNAPKKYWDMYDEDKITLPTNRFRPKNLPNEVQNSKEIYSYSKVKEPEDNNYLKTVIHGYYACVSYIDAQIGMILHELKELELDKNTIIFILGDNGWNLGEHNFIGKHNLMKTSTQIPLIVHIPWLKRGETFSIVELVDIYPTLCDLCNIPTPKNQLHGKSFISILENPKTKTKKYAFIQWEEGYCIMDNRYNYAEWQKSNHKKTIMIFDHNRDPQENKNSSTKFRYKRTIKKLSKRIVRIKEIL